MGTPLVTACPHAPRRFVTGCDPRRTPELNVSIRILDGKYLATHVNNSPQTIAPFENHLRPVTEYLRVVGSAAVIAKSKHVESPAVYVFLRQEVERRSGNTSLVDAVTDALILWALDGTNPDIGELMTKTEIADKICSTVPFAKEFVDTRLDDRLVYLSAKERDSGRVRWHRQEDRYALPHKTREEIAVENAEDDNLRLTVIEGLQEMRWHNSIARSGSVERYGGSRGPPVLV